MNRDSKPMKAVQNIMNQYLRNCAKNTYGFRKGFKADTSKQIRQEIMFNRASIEKKISFGF